MKALRYWIPLMCFFSGGSVMMIELAGFRLLAPIFGNSLYTWTALIGVILFALSAGDCLGGWLVDKKPTLDLVSVFFSLAAIMVFLVLPLSENMEEMSTMDLRWGPLAGCLMLFFIPACLLASITPICIRLLSKTSQDKHVGLSAGMIGMCGALGSFTGTVLSGFYLIPEFGVRRLFLTLGVILLLLAVVVVLLQKATLRQRITLFSLWALTAVLAIRGEFYHQPPRQTIFLQDTAYHRIKVTELKTVHGGTVRYLWQDTVLQGGEYVGCEKPGSPYLYYWQLAQVYCPQLSSALFIGGGAFVMPKQIAKNYPQSLVDVIEIDPATVEVGKRFFNLGGYSNLRVHNDDGRHFLLNSSTTKWDLIYCDAYSGLYSMPAHLVTTQFFQLVKNHLNPGGICMLNFGGVAQGPYSELFSTLYNSFRSAFPEVSIFAVDNPRTPDRMQNFILVASADRNLQNLKNEWLERTHDPLVIQKISPLLQMETTILPNAKWANKVFDDDRNPVELLTVRMCEGVLGERGF